MTVVLRFEYVKDPHETNFVSPLTFELRDRAVEDL